MKKIFMVCFVTLAVFLIQACGVDENSLVVGMECDYAPFNWTTSDDTAEPVSGTNYYCDGYDMMIARQLAASLGRELVVRQVAWEGLIPALLSGEIDVIIAGMSPTPERAETVLFTDAYYVSAQVFVVQSGSTYAQAETLDDFAGARVIAQLGTLQDRLIPQIPDVVHRGALETYASLVTEVLSGASDALIAEWPVALSITQTNPSLTWVDLGEAGFILEASDVSVSIALRQADVALQVDINEILAAISLETRQSWMQDALERQGD
ncbi:MAG: ABC transporter substrate-binding protein [Acholeplasmatales bacterium]|nr:MAG: ABC transporter substrate-binding protein [Acholeplasmatales bacterium]